LAILRRRATNWLETHFWRTKRFYMSSLVWKQNTQTMHRGVFHKYPGLSQDVAVVLGRKYVEVVVHDVDAYARKWIGPARIYIQWESNAADDDVSAYQMHAILTRVYDVDEALVQDRCR